MTLFYSFQKDITHLAVPDQAIHGLRLSTLSPGNYWVISYAIPFLQPGHLQSIAQPYLFAGGLAEQYLNFPLLGRSISALVYFSSA